MTDEVLARAIDGAERLIGVLERERIALGRADAAALEACTAEKDGLLRELRACDNGRLGGAGDGARLRAVLAECARRNSLNGQIIELGQQRTRAALALLRGQPLEPALYGPGHGPAADSASRSLAKA